MLLQLQRRAGNRAVTALVQREGQREERGKREARLAFAPRKDVYRGKWWDAVHWVQEVIRSDLRAWCQAD